MKYLMHSFSTLPLVDSCVIQPCRVFSSSLSLMVGCPLQSHNAAEAQRKHDEAEAKRKAEEI